MNATMLKNFDSYSQVLKLQMSAIRKKTIIQYMLSTGSMKPIVSSSTFASIGSKKEKTRKRAKLGWGNRLWMTNAPPPKARVATNKMGRRAASTTAAKINADAMTKNAPRYKYTLMLDSLSSVCIRVGRGCAAVAG